MNNMDRLERIAARLPETELGRLDAGGWKQVEEWVRTSYTLVAPKSLGKLVVAEDAAR